MTLTGIEDIKEKEQSISDFHAAVLEYANDLHADAGLAYREATKQCLASANNAWTAAESIFPSDFSATVERVPATSQQDENQVQGRIGETFTSR